MKNNRYKNLLKINNESFKFKIKDGNIVATMYSNINLFVKHIINGLVSVYIMQSFNNK